MTNGVYKPATLDLKHDKNATINFRKCRLYFKLLTVSWACFMVPVLLLMLRILPPPQDGGPVFLLLVMAAGALMYYVFLGLLAAANNMSSIVWVGLSIITSPFSYLVSYPMMVAVGVRNHWLRQP